MMRDIRWRSRSALLSIALALLFYALFLAATAPASVAAWVLDRASRGTIFLEGAAGSFWNGRADAVVVSVGAAKQRFNRLTWALNLSPLLRGELSFDLSIDDAKARGRSSLAWRAGMWHISSTALEVASAAIAPYDPVLLIADPQGRLTLRTASMTIGGDSMSGNAELDWKDASTGLSRIAPLGSYRAKVEGAGKKMQFSLDTKEGALQVAGSGTRSREAGLRFEGTARAAAGREAELRPLLVLMGPETSGGVHRIRSGK